jgi:hypothetical protein
MTTLYLLWALIGGQAAIVDVHTSEVDCEVALSAVREQVPDPEIELVCAPAEVQVPTPAAPKARG